MTALTELATWFLIFIFYSFVGWLFETLFSVVVSRKPANRGFLVGPICPLYGTGALLISFALGNMENVVAIFCVSMVGAATLEYFTSWAMEKLFHVRWWDYSDMPFNLNGRICLHAMVIFGVLGVVIIRVANPFLLGVLSSFNANVVVACSAIILGLLLIDVLLSLWMIVGFRVTVGTVERDATAEISVRVRQIMMEKGRLNRRLVKAFPGMEAKKATPRKKKSSKTAKTSKPSK